MNDASETNAGAILFVRVRSDLPWEALEPRVADRKPHFLKVPGLRQKYYGRDPATGDVCGIYFFDSADALAAFRTSELAQTIGAAYEATDVRREVFQVLFPLRDGVDPLSSGT